MPRLSALFLILACSLFPAAWAADKEQAGGIIVDKEKRTITIGAKMAPRKLADPKFQGISWPVEVVACWPYPKGQKAHETVVTIDIKPSEVHKALEGFGLKPGAPVTGDVPPAGPEVKLYLLVPGADGKPRRLSMERVLIDPKTNKPLPKSVQWRFTGSVMSQPDPNKDEKVYGADLTGTLIAIYPVTNQTVLQSSLTMKEEKYLKLEINKDVVPKEGTPVQLVIEVPAKK